jgi:ribosome maturation factor RimP
LANSRKRGESISNIEQIAKEVLEPLGYEVLEVQLNHGKKSTTVLVRIDRLDEAPVTTTDLERCSRVLGLEFDRLDPIQNAYRLEFESPGGKRPLLRQRHFERMLGLKAKVKVAGVGGFVGKIVEVTPEEVVLEGDKQERRSFALLGIVANLTEFPDKHR